MPPAFDPEATLVQKLRSCEGHVDPIVMSQAATPVEQHLLRALAVSSEQNIILGDTLQRVVYQTTKTNGRLLQCEREVKEVAAKAEVVKTELDAWHVTQKHWRGILMGGICCVSPVIYFLIEIALNHWFR